MTDESHPEQLPSNKNFGYFFAVLLALGGVYVTGKLHSLWGVVWLLAAALLAAVTVLAPHRLAPLNRLWFALGLLLGRIVRPIVLGILFFALITPIALIMRMARRDALRLRRSSLPSLWLTRAPESFTPDSFKRPF
ncbi:MAG: hypothetical protein HQL91_05135 [Magnetococcales bacterium]|nr:hypothetical protein [Magnetococcales bacterium]